MLLTSANRNVLIIGATGGIGLAMTQRLLAAGHRLFVTLRNRDSDAAEQLASLEQQHPQQLTLLQMDITQQQSIETAFATIQSECKVLHLVFNCSGLLHAGGMKPEKRLEDLEAEKLANSFLVNSIGPMLVARYALPLLKHDEPSVLANLSARVGSISDNRIGGWYGYRASKAAQNMATKTIAIELKRRSKNTIVVGLHPGTVDTSLSKPFQSAVRPGQLKTPAEAVENLCAVLDQLHTSDSGKVFAWDGSEIDA